MRSHAKASSAGSTLGRASRSGSFVRGVDILRGASSDVDGSGALSHRLRLVALSLAAALVTLALCTSSASASKQVISFFGTNSGSGGFGGELNNPRGVAVNSAGLVYVADEANNRIERFAANGAFLSAWGENVVASSVNERQRIVLEASAGTYTLSFDGSTTDPISSGSGSFGVQDELAALPTVGGAANVKVSGSGKPADPFVVTFQGALGGANQPTVSADASELSGAVAISTIVNGTSTVPDDTGSGFEICTVATECQAGTASGVNGALDSPQSVAIDPDTDNVYVSDRGNRRIDEYDAGGNFIRSFGWNVVESGPGDTGTGYEVCNQAESDVCKSGEGGAGVGQYGEGFAEGGFGIAVSPADGNVATGTVYLADSGNRRVDTFDLDGASPSSFGSSAQFGEGQPRSVAVDSRGIVYASDSNNGGDIQRYDSANADGGGVGFLAPILPPNDEVQEITFAGFEAGDSFTLTCPDGSPTGELTYTTGEDFQHRYGAEVIQNGLEEACGEEGKEDFSTSGNPPSVTVTFQGDLAGTGQPPMTCTRLSGTGSCAVTTISDGHPGPLLRGEEAATTTVGLAVNPAGTVLYVLRDPSGFRVPTVVQQLGPTNEPGLTAAPTAADDTHGAAAGFEAVRGFGFDSASGHLFVSATGDIDEFEGPLAAAHRVYVLADPSALPDPTASMPLSGAVTAIVDRSATFHGSVDPQGGLVGCAFQYSTDEAHWSDASVPACAALNQNGGEQNISQKVSGLIPGQKYFVRLQVTRPYLPDFTPIDSTRRVSFTTATGVPILSGASAGAVDEHSVRVTATIDPSNSPTSYVVQYGTTPSLGSSTAPVNIGGGSEPIEVSPVIGGLSPATQYYFKLLATNLAGSTASGGLAIGTFPSPTNFGSCPNDLLRTGPSAKLPDCRAYEQVTPTDKFGSDASGSAYGVEASPSGDGITFFTFAGFPGSEGFQEVNFFLSRFAGDKWLTAGLNPPPSFGDKANVTAWTPDLRLSFASAHVTGGLEGDNLVMRASADGSRAVLIPEGARFASEESEAFSVGGTFDGDSKVVLGANGAGAVTSGPVPVSEERNVYLYDRETGELTLAGLLPDSACGSPPCVPAGGAKLPASFGEYVQEGHVVSPHGDIYFADGETGQLYVRREAAGPDASTVQVSASERTDCADNDPCSGTPEPDPAGTSRPTFMGATPDGAHAFFKSAQKLTDDSTSTAGAEDLYRFDAEAPAGQRLSDLAPGAKVVGVLGYSDGGDHLYFAANADLDGTGPATAGNCAGTAIGNFNTFFGSCSVYLWQADGAGSCASANGCIGLVARLDAGAQEGESNSDGYDWAGAGGHPKEMKASRVSADGRVLVFRSKRPLTAYDNEGACRNAGEPAPCPQFYRYEAESEQITCLTCDPTGAPPIGAPEPKIDTSGAAYGAQLFLGRNLSADGNRFFFETPQKLVPADVNGEAGCSTGPSPSCLDVYEWEAPGSGSCTTNTGAFSPPNGGCIYLLSTGTGSNPSSLADVSESGDTAFIFSRQQLVPSDEDAQEDIYAVKVDGGLAYQHAARPAACEGDACRGPSSKSSDAPGAGTAVFQGPGNPKQNTNSIHCPKGKRTVHAKGKVRCVAKHTKHRKQKRRPKRAANNNRRASR